MEVICMKKMNPIRIMVLLLCSSLMVDLQAMKNLSGEELLGEVNVDTTMGAGHTVSSTLLSSSSSSSSSGEAKTEANAEVKSGEIILDEARTYLDNNIDEVLDSIIENNGILVGVYEFPSFYIKFKGSFRSRITGIKILQECITKNKLDLIFLPAKRIYRVLLDRVKRHDIGRIPREFCIAQKIKGIEGKAINLKQAKQLCILAKETNFYDLHRGNLILCGDERIAIIDTGEEGFRPTLIAVGLGLLCGNDCLEPDADALEYIRGEKRKIEDSEIKEPSVVS